jgi:hypothetical protein
MIIKMTLFWKIMLISFCLIGLSTGIFRSPGFWSSYVLDIAGPAWNYILIRGIYHSKHPSFLSIRFSPESALLLIIVICFLIETSQYFNLYSAHFDLYDYIAYVSGIIPCYIIDKLTLEKNGITVLNRVQNRIKIFFIIHNILLVELLCL